MSGAKVSLILIATIQYLYLLTCISMLNKVYQFLGTFILGVDRTTSIQDSLILQCGNNSTTCDIILYKQGFFF